MVRKAGELPVVDQLTNRLTLLSIEGMDAAQVAYQQYIGPDAQVDLALMATIIKTYARVTQAESMQQKDKLRDEAISVSNQLELMAYTSAGHDPDLSKFCALLAGQIKAVLVNLPNQNEYPAD